MSLTPERFEIPGVDGPRADVVFLGLEEQIFRRLREIEHDNRRSVKCFAEFLKDLRSRVSEGLFAEIQRKWLRPGVLSAEEAKMLKFFDIVHWCEGKFRIAWQMGLAATHALYIIDIGTGAGHFCCVAEFLGHRVTGTDLILPEQGSQLPEMYADLRRVLGVSWIAHRSTVDMPLPRLAEDIDVCTSFLTKFHVRDDGQPWSLFEWKRFFRNLAPRFPTGGGRVYFQLNEEHITEEVWTFLEKRSDRSVAVSRQIDIGSKLGALLLSTSEDRPSARSLQ